jgi:hypothetical protein
MRWLREDPENRRVRPRQYAALEMNLDQFRAWFLAALDEKINRSAPERINDRGVAHRRLRERAGQPVRGWDADDIERARAWRKDDSDWERNARYCAGMVNTPRLVVRAQSIPLEFRARLASRLWSDEQ